MNDLKSSKPESFIPLDTVQRDTPNISEILV